MSIVVYRFYRLVFGLKPSSAILGATIKNYLSNCLESEPDVIEVLKNDPYEVLKNYPYVDGLATGTDSEDISLFKLPKGVMRKGGFNTNHRLNIVDPRYN